MYKKSLSWALSAVLGLSAWLTPVHAATFPTIQPYVSNFKIGFTNGSKSVTPPVYDQFSKEKEVIVVTKAGKQGLLDAKSGKEIIPPVWDHIEVPDGKNVAILRKGGMVQYFLTKQKVWSKHKFRQAHTFFLSNQHPSVIAFEGDVSTLLDADGTVLLAPFRGSIRFADWLNGPKPGQTERESTRYVVYQTDKLLALLDPVNLKPLFQVPGVRVKNDSNLEIQYLEVTANGKSGLVGKDGSVVLEPQYQSLVNIGNGFIKIVSDKGVGLFKDGKIVAEPVYADAGAFHDWDDGFYTVQGDVVTYHSLSLGTSFSLKKGAEYLTDGYVVGQDPATGKYGVKRLSGETVVPFAYLALEGPPAAWTLVRSDGKKGLLVQRNDQVSEPEFWFDSYTTLGSYSMLAIKDGNRYGLYSQSKGLLIPPRENITFRYDSDWGAVLVTDETGKTLQYTEWGDIRDWSQPEVRKLTEQLSVSHVRGQGVTILSSSDMKPVAGPYQGVYLEGNGKFVVAISGDRADLFTANGERITGEVGLAVPSIHSGSPLTAAAAGGVFYALGVKQGVNGRALVCIANGKGIVLTGFDYSGLSGRELNANRALLTLTRLDGTSDLLLVSGAETVARLDGVQDLVTSDSLPVLFIKTNGAWDVYNTELQPLTRKRYKSLRVVTNMADNQSLIVYQDGKTGRYGILKRDMSEQTPAKYEWIRPVSELFPQLYRDRDLPMSFVFATDKQFGYVNGAGQEIFQTPLFSRKPNITQRPLTVNTFPAFAQLLDDEATQVVNFGKPYRLHGAESEPLFVANLALYLGLPKETGKQEVFAALAAKGIIPATEKRTDFSYEDFFSLAYYMYNGKPHTSLTKQQLWEWGMRQGLYYERSPHEHADPYADFNRFFINKLLLYKHAGEQVKARTLSLQTLTEQQESMLLSQVQVNGTDYQSLLFPLPREWVQQTLQQLIKEYNQNAPRLLQATIK
jgi:hypothetical protein